MKTIIDKIGPWTEVKLDIIREYATAYSTILAAQRRPGFDHVYIDAFAGAGVHMSKKTGEFVRGSPLNALKVEPQFREYYFIDIDKIKVGALHEFARQRPEQIHIFEGNCNDILLTKVFPEVRYEDYRRGLCLLDPYGLHLAWKVIETAGRMRSIEIFFNLSIYDMNLNVLLRNPAKTRPGQIARMNTAWGDDSWRGIVYRTNGNLFGHPEKNGDVNYRIAEGFRERLKSVAGFSYVPDPMPMRNSKGNILYFLFFASSNPYAANIVQQIFDKYRDRGI